VKVKRKTTMSNKNEVLKACECGGEDLTLSNYEHAGISEINCNCCDLYLGGKFTEEELIAKWNEEPSQPSSQWQDIASAPRDVYILVYVWGEVEIGMHVTNKGWRSNKKCEDWGSRIEGNPTHWQPLPTPPSENEPKGE